MRYIFILLCMLSIAGPAWSQYDVNFYADGHASSVFLDQSKTHTNTGRIKVPCSDLFLDYELTTTLVTDNSTSPPSYVIGNWLLYTNTNSEAVSFIVCEMVDFAIPYPETKRLDEETNQPLDMSVPVDLFFMEKGPSGYTCADRGTGHDYNWSFHFGCDRVTVPANGSAWAFDGWHQVPSESLKAFNGGILGNDHETPILLDGTRFDENDKVNATWRLKNNYLDYLADCPIDPDCDDLKGRPNSRLEPSQDALACSSNAWNILTMGIKPQGGGGNGRVQIPVDLGNWVTMSDMANYASTFKGYLAGAPAGTQLRAFYPASVSSTGVAIMDSGRAYSDTVVACVSDTMGFSFPFVIPEMGGYMQFEIQLPNTMCSGISNGHKIFLHGEVFARETTAYYDSAQFMYGVSSTVLYDATPPHISNFQLNALDSEHLIINLTASDDTAMVSDGFVRVSEGGGPTRIRVLRYQNNLSVGNTTQFLDTLTFHTGATVIVQAIARNIVGLSDTSWIDTCTLAPVTNRVNSILDGPATLTLDSKTGSFLLRGHKRLGDATYEVFDLLGRSLFTSDPVRIEGTDLHGQIPVQFSGAYFLRLTTDEGTLTQKIIF